MTEQSVFELALPDGAPIDGMSAFAAEHLAQARRMLDEAGAGALAIVLPPAAAEHDDWRRAIARDLARAHTPARVNVVSGSAGAGRDALVAYLANAPGVTGQYLAVHE